MAQGVYQWQYGLWNNEMDRHRMSEGQGWVEKARGGCSALHRSPFYCWMGISVLEAHTNTQMRILPCDFSLLTTEKVNKQFTHPWLQNKPVWSFLWPVGHTNAQSEELWVSPWTVASPQSTGMLRNLLSTAIQWHLWVRWWKKRYSEVKRWFNWLLSNCSVSLLHVFSLIRLDKMIVPISVPKVWNWTTSQFS